MPRSPTRSEIHNASLHALVAAWYSYCTCESKHVPRNELSAVLATSIVCIGKANDRCLLLSKAYAQILSAFEVSNNSFCCFRMHFSRVCQEPTNHSYCKSNFRMCSYHSIHQTVYIGDSHLKLSIMRRRAVFCNEFHIWRQWNPFVFPKCWDVANSWEDSNRHAYLCDLKEEWTYIMKVKWIYIPRSNVYKLRKHPGRINICHGHYTYIGLMFIGHRFCLWEVVCARLSRRYADLVADGRKCAHL